jgi:hypothetical protein
MWHRPNTNLEWSSCKPFRIMKIHVYAAPFGVLGLSEKVHNS